jgi:hypothetical protein
VDPALAVPIIIPCPFVDAVAHRGMGGMTTPIALPLISVQLRTASWKVLEAEPMTSLPVRMVAPQKRGSPVSRDMILMIGGRSLA